MANVTKQLITAEDIDFGLTEVIQVRQSGTTTSSYTLHRVNASHIPYTDALSIKAVLDTIVSGTPTINISSVYYGDIPPAVNLNPQNGTSAFYFDNILKEFYLCIDATTDANIWLKFDKTLVGLSNVDNTSDVDKPVSTAQDIRFTAVEDTANAALPASTYTATDILTKVKTVDGPGSGLDADTVDGIEGINIAQQTDATGSAIIPSGTTAQRPASPANGYMRYNTDLSAWEAYNATAALWLPIGGGATGGGTDDVFYENSQVVTQDYILTAGKNAMSAGDVTINDGVTVTIPDGSNWVIV